MNILALNAGSSSLKYKLFKLSETNAEDGESVLAEGEEDRDAGIGIADAAEKVINDCAKWDLHGIAHRVVHGGSKFTEPTLVTPDVLKDLRTLRELDELHNPSETDMIETGLRLLPQVPAIAVFDTAFHSAMPETAWRYALPRDLSDRLNLRRYGFHGLSYQYVSGKLIELLGRGVDGTKLIVCHLGSGASICAIRDGKSVDTSMGMTPLEGLVMGTRAGDIDAGLLLYLVRHGGLHIDQLDAMLNKQSGLLGVSGSSADVRQLEKSSREGDASAEMALEVFAYRVRKYIGAYAAVLNGVDSIAFTGGIGEHSAEMRSRICRNLSFMGIAVNSQLNESIPTGEAARISPPNSTVQVWLVPTDEELQMVRNAKPLIVSSN